MEDGLCRRCEEEDEALEHVMECEAGRRRRAEFEVESLRDLVRKPEDSLKYWRWWRRRRLKEPEG